MQARGDQRVQEALLKALRSGPRDVLEIRNAVRTDLGTVIAGREGHLHAFLHDGLRRGVIRVVGTTQSGLARYAKPDPGKSDTAPVEIPELSGPDDSAAARSISASVRDAASRPRIAADVVAHRRALQRQDALDGFGSVRSARNLMRRADRGKRTVFFTDGFGDTLKKGLLHEGPWIIITVVAFLVIRAFLAEVFVIPSTSMVPTLLEWDRVVVLKPGGRGEPERWSIVTFKRGETTYVKRAAGLGGEELALVGGDLYIDRALVAKPPELAAALRAPYTTWTADAIRDTWTRTAEAEGRETFAYEGSPLWSTAAPATRPRAPRDVRLRDAYAMLHATRAAGSGVALDLVYRREGEDAPAAVYRLEVSDAGVRHVVEIRGETSFIQRQPGAVTGATTLKLAYVDGVLEAEVGGARWSQSLGADDRPPVGAWLQPQIRRWGAGAELGALRLDRDHHYTQVGQFGVPPSSATGADLTYGYRIPENTVFFLGDNTANSNDSRFSNVGTIPYGDLIGPVRFRIWPPSRLGFPE